MLAGVSGLSGVLPQVIGRCGFAIALGNRSAVRRKTYSIFGSQARNMSPKIQRFATGGTLEELDDAPVIMREIRKGPRAQRVIELIYKEAPMRFALRRVCVWGLVAMFLVAVAWGPVSACINLYAKNLRGEHVHFSPGETRRILSELKGDENDRANEKAEWEKKRRDLKAKWALIR
jgi:hypothetical protein